MPSWLDPLICLVALVGFIWFALRQGTKVSPDPSPPVLRPKQGFRVDRLYITTRTVIPACPGKSCSGYWSKNACALEIASSPDERSDIRERQYDRSRQKHNDPVCNKIPHVASLMRATLARLIPRAGSADSFWDSQIRKTLTRC